MMDEFDVDGVIDVDEAVALIDQSDTALLIVGAVSEKPALGDVDEPEHESTVLTLEVDH